MNITAGGLGVNATNLALGGGLTGAFMQTGTFQGKGNESWSGAVVGFNAKRSWTGYTSNDGSHSHGMSLNTTGGGKGHTHTLEGATHSHNVTVEKPPFYQLAFFVKLPE